MISIMMSFSRRRKPHGNESPKLDNKSPQKSPNPNPPEGETMNQRQLNGTVKTAPNPTIDSNCNSVKENVNLEYEKPPELPADVKKEETKKVKTPTHERR